MISRADISQKAKSVGLALRGVLRPDPDPSLPETTRSIVLLGPDEPHFWPLFSASSEFKDGAGDPMDRWSKRICTGLAKDWRGKALFPSDGPPYPPFLAWALGSDQAWSSPVGLLVQSQAGLFISYRCAIALPYALPEEPEVSPCINCHSPCETACPVGAIAPGQEYDLARCKSYLRSPAGQGCMSGCLVRRACPVSQKFPRSAEQSAFHMAAFLKN